MSTDDPSGAAAIAGLPRDRMLAEFSLWSADLANLAADPGTGGAVRRRLPYRRGRRALRAGVPVLPRPRRADPGLTRRPIHVHLMVEGDVLDRRSGSSPRPGPIWSPSTPKRPGARRGAARGHAWRCGRGGAAARDAGRGDRAVSRAGRLRDAARHRDRRQGSGPVGPGLRPDARGAEGCCRQGRCWPPMAASGRRPCRCCGRPGRRPWCSGRSRSATRTSRRGSAGCARRSGMDDAGGPGGRPRRDRAARGADRRTPARSSGLPRSRRRSGRTGGGDRADRGAGRPAFAVRRAHGGRPRRRCHRARSIRRRGS